MERSYLIFKEVTFVKRTMNNQYDGEEDEDPLGNKIENNIKDIKSEKDVQSRIQLICQPPTM